MRHFLRTTVVCLLMGSSLTYGLPPEVHHPTNLYLRIGVYPDASYLEIIDAAERLIGLYRHRQEHGGVGEPLVLLSEALSVLANPVDRLAYDQKSSIPLIQRVSNYDIDAKLIERKNRILLSARGNGSHSAPLDVVELEEMGPARPTLSHAPVESSLLEALQTDDFDQLAKDLDRDDILYKTPRYQAYLQSLKERFYKKGQAPSAFKNFFEAEFHSLQARYIPGLSVLTPALLVAHFSTDSMIPLVLGVLIGGGDLAFKFIYGYSRPRQSETKLWAYLNDRRKPHMKPNAKSRAPGLTLLCDDLLRFDLWNLLLEELRHGNQKGMEVIQKDVDVYLEYYADLHSPDALSIRHSRRDPGFASALLYRMSQSLGGEAFNLMERNPKLWLLRLSELRIALEGRLAVDSNFVVPEGEENSLKRIQTRLQVVASQRGLTSNIKEKITSCRIYYRQLAQLTKAVWTNRGN